jgi:hypothetical protein
MPMKKKLLQLFIPHFIEMARKSIHFKATKQARFYLKHAERLQKLLRECDVGRPEEDYYSREFAILYEEMGTGSAAPTKLKQPELTETPQKSEKSVKFTPSTLSQDVLFSNVHALRNKIADSRKNLHSPSPSTETCYERSQPKTNIVTRAQVHTNTNRTHTAPSTSTSPESRTDVTDNPNKSPTITLMDRITRESTDT